MVAVDLVLRNSKSCEYLVLTYGWLLHILILAKYLRNRNTYRYSKILHPQ